MSLFTKDKVPGRTISVWGVKPALVMWIVVTPDAGVAVGVTFTGATVVTTAVVTFTARGSYICNLSGGGCYRCHGGDRGWNGG